MLDAVTGRSRRLACEQAKSILVLFLSMIFLPSTTGFAPQLLPPRPKSLPAGAGGGTASGERDAEREGEEREALLHKDGDGLGRGASSFPSGDLDDAWTRFQRELISQGGTTTPSPATDDDDLSGSAAVPRVLSRIENVGDVLPGTILVSSSDFVAPTVLPKAIVLVLESGPLGTSGVLLNRGPMSDVSPLAIDGTVLPGSEGGWTAWFGGDHLFDHGEDDDEDVETDAEDVGGSVADNTLCLFFDEDIDPTGEASVGVLEGVRVTFHKGAREFVHAGSARPEDFMLFYGHMRWSGGALEEELRMGLWDAARVASGGDPLDILTGIRDRSAETTAGGGGGAAGGKAIVDPTYGEAAWSYARQAMGMVSPATTDANVEAFGDEMLRDWTLLNLPHARDARIGALKDLRVDGKNNDNSRP